jgi:hypothetical protein
MKKDGSAKGRAIFALLSAGAWVRPEIAAELDWGALTDFVCAKPQNTYLPAERRNPRSIKRRARAGLGLMQVSP